ncbi:MAG: aspartate-semialdehyde dehydrogenase [Armatimonadetes bacterium]|nr:aspartate-semialdehyde dehydrogenase [Armatimonadota bacterium]
MALRVGVVGVGPVGDRILRCLYERNFPLADEPVIMATRERVEVLADREVQVHETRAELFQGLDVVFFAGREGAKGASRQWAQTAIEAGAYCIDNGSDFRLHPDVPLVIPEVNIDVVTPEDRLIASPNCSTIQTVVAIAPLHRAAGVKRLVAATYQSVSGWGAAAMEELERQVKQLAAGQEVTFDPSVFTRPIALDCIPHIDRFLPNGYTKEEMKMVHETRKILDAPEMQITATCVRVPVMIGHAVAANLEFKAPLSADEAIEILSTAPGVVLIGCCAGGQSGEVAYPTQRDVLRDEYKDLVLVGRVRDDETVDSGINMWIVADNLRKGAATNVVQIAEGLIERGFFDHKL